MSVCAPVLLGSSRKRRKSVHVGNLIVHALGARKAVTTELLDLAEYDLPLMVERLEDMQEPPPQLVRLHSQLRAADGLIIVAPEYKNGYPAVLKNAMDYMEAGIFNGKAVGIATVSSGGFGGLNCLAQLRLVCLAMGGLAIPAVFPVSSVEQAFSETGELIDERLSPKLEKFIDSFLWYTEALANHRSLKPAL